MSGIVTEVYQTKFSSNMRLSLQQGAQPRLAMLSGEEAGSGEMYLLENIVEPRKMNSRRERHAPTYTKPSTYDRTWVGQPDEKDDAELFDKLDKVAAAIEPQSGFMMSGKLAINRMRDDIWIGGWDGTGGFYGNRMSGKTGSVLVPFAAGNVVPVAEGAAAATGLNLAKVLAAREILAAGFAEMEEQWYFGVTAKQVTDLFQQYQVASEDFKDSYKVRLDASGKKIIGMLGFEFVEFEFSDTRLDNYATTVDGSGYRKNPFWTKSGMKRVQYYDVQTSVDVRTDLSNAIQCRYAFSETQTRTDEARCGYVLNNEA